MGRTRVDVSEALGGLEPSTTYHVRLCAQAPDFDAFCGDDQSFTTAAEPAPTELSITATPALYPAFDPAVSDYVTRCGERPGRVRRRARRRARTVAVDGGDGAQRALHRERPAGRRAAGDDHGHDRRDDRHLPRPLPAGRLPGLDPPAQRPAERRLDARERRRGVHRAQLRGLLRQPRRARLVVQAPSDSSRSTPSCCRTTAWRSPNGFSASFNANPALKYQVRRLDGTLVRTLQTVGVPTDFHDLQELPNGNYLLVAYKPRDHVDLSAYGESERRHRAGRRDPGDHARRAARVVVELQGPHRPRRDRPLVEHPQPGAAARRSPGHRPRPHQRRRARRRRPAHLDCATRTRSTASTARRPRRVEARRHRRPPRA